MSCMLRGIGKVTLPKSKACVLPEEEPMRIHALTLLIAGLVRTEPLIARTAIAQNQQSGADKGIKTRNSVESGYVGDVVKARASPPRAPRARKTPGQGLVAHQGTRTGRLPSGLRSVLVLEANMSDSRIGRTSKCARQQGRPPGETLIPDWWTIRVTA